MPVFCVVVQHHFLQQNEDTRLIVKKFPSYNYIDKIKLPSLCPEIVKKKILQLSHCGHTTCLTTCFLLSSLTVLLLSTCLFPLGALIPFFFFFTSYPFFPLPFLHPIPSLSPLVPWGDVSPVTNKLMWKSNKRLCGLSGFLSPQATETLIKEPRGAVGQGVHSTSGQTQATAASLTQRAGYRASYQVLGTTEEFW